jgi:hypothetical protein
MPTRLQSWDYNQDRFKYPRVLVSTASGARHLIDMTTTPPTVTRILPADREVNYLEVPDEHGHHSGTAVFLGDQAPAEDEATPLVSLRADGSSTKILGTIGLVRIGAPMTMILVGLAPGATTLRSTTVVTGIELWPDSAS